MVVVGWWVMVLFVLSFELCCCLLCFVVGVVGLLLMFWCLDMVFLGWFGELDFFFEGVRGGGRVGLCLG